MARRSKNSTPGSGKSQFVRADMTTDELRREWRRLYNSDAPKLSYDLLVLGITYRIQEIEHGGLGKATLRKLRTLVKNLHSTGRVSPAPALSPKPGTRLVREWHGRTHTITVTEDGFEYGGENYASLTKNRQENHGRTLVGATVLRADGEQ